MSGLFRKSSLFPTSTIGTFAFSHLLLKMVMMIMIMSFGMITLMMMMP